MKWFRLYNEFATDYKVQTLDERLQRRLVLLYCAKSNGYIPGMSDFDVGF